MKKLILIVFTACLFLLPTTFKADNENVLHVDGNPVIIDEDDLLSVSEQQALTTRLNKLKSTYGLDVVILIPKTLNAQSAQVYADDFYDYNNYADDGVLILLCLETRDWYVSTKGKGITYVTDYGLDWAFNKFVEYFSNSDYYKGFDCFCDCLDTLFENGKNGTPIDHQNRVREMSMQDVLIALSAGLIVTIIVIIILKKQLKSVKVQHYAANYIVPNSFRLIGFSDYFTGTTRTQRKIERHDDHGSGGSSTHSSSSGSSHGGGGGKF